MILEVSCALELWRALRAYGLVVDRSRLEGLYDGAQGSVELEVNGMEVVISRILAVWGRNGVRFAFLSSRELFILNDREAGYDHLVQGNHVLDHHIIVIGELDEAGLEVLGGYLGGCMGVPQVIDLGDLVCGGLSMESEFWSGEAFRELREGVRREGNRLDNRFLYVGDGKYGVEDLEFSRYLSSVEDMIGDDDFSEGEESSVSSWLRGCIFEDVSSIGAEGDYAVWVGQRSVRYSVRAKRGGHRRFLDGVLLRDGLEVAWALEKAQSISGEEFAGLLRGLRSKPLFKRWMEERGVVLLLDFRSQGCRGDVAVLRLGLRWQGGRWFLVSPLDGGLAHVRGGVRTLNRVFRDYEGTVRGCITADNPLLASIDYHSSYRVCVSPVHALEVLCEFFPEDAVLEMLDRSRLRFERAVERARALLGEVLRRHGDRVARGVLSVDGVDLEGYVVKGNRRNYFVSDGAEVYSYPGGDFICVEGRGDGYGDLLALDKVVALIHLCLNDDALGSIVRVLEDGDDGPRLVLRVERSQRQEVEES